MLDGRRRQRAAYVRVPTGAPRELDFVGLPLSCRGETVKGMNHRIERAAYLPRRRAVGARESSVAGSAARRWRRRHLLREAAASDRPPSVRSAGGGGMFGAHGKITYLSLPFCALMRQHGRLLRLGLRHRRSDPIVITDRSSSLCVHGPPGSIRWAGLVCGASPPRRRVDQHLGPCENFGCRRIIGAPATRLPRTIHRCGGGRHASTGTAAELVL